MSSNADEGREYRAAESLPSYKRKPLRSHENTAKGNRHVASQGSETVEARRYYETEAVGGHVGGVYESGVAAGKVQPRENAEVRGNYETSAAGAGGGERESSEAVSEGERSLSQTITRAESVAAARSKYSVSQETEEDARSTTSVDSMDKELFGFQQKAATQYIESEDWDGAEEAISGLLQNTLITGDSEKTWRLEYARVLFNQKKCQESLAILGKLHGCQADLLTARVYFSTGRMEEAKRTCTKTMKILRKSPEQQSLYEASLSLMAELLDATGKKTEANFYRSKIPPGDGKPTPPEAKQETHADVPSEIREILKSHQASYNTTTGCLEGSDTAMWDVWYEAMEANNKNLADLCLRSCDKLAKVIDADGFTALHIAARFDRETYLTALYERGANLDAHSITLSDGRSSLTPLHVAVFYNGIRAAEVLLKLGANINAPDASGYTPFHYAIDRNSSTLVSRLLENGASLEVKAEEGVTPLLYATYHLSSVMNDHDYDIIQSLLSRGADAGVVDASGSNALHVAVLSKNLKLVERLVTNRNIETRDKGNLTPLLLAVLYSTPEIVGFLLSVFANIKAVDRKGDGALHQAVLAKEGCYEKLTMLTKYGASINLQNVDGLTPLHYAAAWRGKREVRHLLDRGADCKVQEYTRGFDVLKFAIEEMEMEYEKDEERSLTVIKILTPHSSFELKDRSKDGWTATHVAADSDNVAVLNYMLTNQKTAYEVNIPDIKGRTPLHIAAISTNGAEIAVRKINTLVDRGASIAAVDAAGNTPLLLCARNGTEEACLCLLNNGADAKARNRVGMTALHMAMMNRDLAILKLFLGLGIDPNLKDSVGMTALQMSIHNPNQDTAKLFESLVNYKKGALK